MKKIILVLLFSFLTLLPVFAFEDYIITTNGKLTNIKIQHNDIINVFPLITITNDKNILIVEPLKEGSTKFTVLKNNKDKYLFSVKVTKENTFIEDVKGFEIFTVDCPPGGYEYYFDLDEPPVINNDDKFINTSDEPPVLRGENK